MILNRVRKNCVTAIQGHPRLLLLAATESMYVTSY